MQHGQCGKNLTWQLNGNGTLKISGTGDPDDYGFIDEDYTKPPKKLRGIHCAIQLKALLLRTALLRSANLLSTVAQI